MLRISGDGAVTRLTLDRPEVRNALDEHLIGALADAFDRLPAECRVVIIEGEGKAFCAGGDLDWMKRTADYSEEENRREALQLARLIHRIAHCAPVTIAKVHGAAFGGGCGLAAACDYTIAERQTKFSFSEAKLGLIPAVISPIVLPKIGAGWARALFTTAKVFSAETALQIGLVHEIADGDGLDQATEKAAADVLKCGPEAVADARSLCLGDLLSPEESASRLATARARDEGKEGVRAFLEKRAPAWAVSAEGDGR